MAEVHSDGAKQAAKIEEDYAKQRRRAAESHRDNLMSAAARLDAMAVYEEQKRFARDARDAAEEHADRLQEQRDAQQESIDDLREHLEEARKIEDEDRELQRQRAEEDHQQQLSQLDQDYAERLDKNGMSESQQYEYRPNPNGRIHVFRLTKRGWRNKAGNGLMIGKRERYYDYSF